MGYGTHRVKGKPSTMSKGKAAKKKKKPMVKNKKPGKK